jgi:DHA2 family multidrug resistance protein
VQAQHGIALFAASCFMNIRLSYDDSGDQFLIPNIVRAVGQALVITPLTAIAMAEIAPKDAGNASGLFNMLRNLGGAIGTASLQTIITKREQYHSNIIGQSVTIFRPEVRDRIAQMMAYFRAHGVTDLATAQHQAIIAVGQVVRRQALVMGFADTFAVVGVMLAIAAVCLLFARKAKPGAAAANAH